MGVSGEDEADRARFGRGTERPEDLPPAGGPIAVDRTFAFVDLSGFTAFIEDEGVAAAVEMLALFRLGASEVTARRGVRVAKWLGDGAMVVGVHAGPTVAAVAELMARVGATSRLQLRAGVARGGVILFQGDDYIGRAVNIAARLCDVAPPGEMLATPRVAAEAPDWVCRFDTRRVELRGVGLVDGVSALGLADDVTLPPVPVSSAE
jgi:adenylate cyclase